MTASLLPADCAIYLFIEAIGALLNNIVAPPAYADKQAEKHDYRSTVNSAALVGGWQKWYPDGNKFFLEELPFLDTAVLENLYRWFASYTRSFAGGDAVVRAMVLQKEEHSLIVARHNRDLAASLGLDAAASRLAEAVGLCHDVGRFRQATEYRTFRDRDSVDHGRLGVEEMLAAGLDTAVTAGDWEVLAFAVRWHNAMALPKEVDPRLVFHANMIRDTDKLDICRVLPPAPPAGGCSPQMAADFIAGRLLSYDDIRKADDRKLVMLSWLFDINFPWTVREIAARGYVERLLASLPPSPAMTAIRAKTERFLAEKLTEI